MKKIMIIMIMIIGFTTSTFAADAFLNITVGNKLDTTKYNEYPMIRLKGSAYYTQKDISVFDIAVIFIDEKQIIEKVVFIKKYNADIVHTKIEEIPAMFRTFVKATSDKFKIKLDKRFCKNMYRTTNRSFYLRSVKETTIFQLPKSNIGTIEINVYSERTKTFKNNIMFSYIIKQSVATKKAISNNLFK